jgi:ATPase subunit of ABC transporter with duplicated ATPase domains
MILDEPTNHLDMESIESLNLAVHLYTGTVIFVSHDREFVSSLANRIIELGETKHTDYKGNYEEYLESQGTTRSDYSRIIRVGSRSIRMGR